MNKRTILTTLRRDDALARRAFLGADRRRGLCRFPVILTGARARCGLVASSPLERRYDALCRAMLDNRKRVGRQWARHSGAMRILRRTRIDHDAIEAWRHANRMKARGFLFSRGMGGGVHGRWVQPWRPDLCEAAD